MHNEFSVWRHYDINLNFDNKQTNNKISNSDVRNQTLSNIIQGVVT